MITAHRRSSEWVEATRWLRDDRTGHLSQTKMIAMLFSLVTAYCAVRSITIAITTLTFGVVSGSIAFGVKTFNHELDKLELKSTLAATVSDSTTRSETIQHTITETRGPTGEPMKSLPPRDDARTPSGDE